MIKKNTMLKQLTKRQKEVLDFTTTIIELLGEPPTMREIADALELHSPSNIQRILGDLEKKGYVHLRRSSQIINLKTSSGAAERPPLNYREAKVFDFVFKKIGDSGLSPTYREIKENFEGVSLGNIFSILKSLEDKDYLFIGPGHSYLISLTTPDNTAIYPVPFQGVPCDAKNFLSPSRGDAWVESLQLSKLIPNFKNSDVHSIFGLVISDKRGIYGFSEGDYILFNRRIIADVGDLVAVIYQKRVIIRYWVFTSASSMYFSSQKSKTLNKINEFDESKDIKASLKDLSIIGVAVSAIIRNIGKQHMTVKEDQEL